MSIAASLLALMAPALAAPTDRLIQVEDLGGAWKRQTNISGYLGLGFCTSNANPRCASSVMEGRVDLPEGGRWRIWARGLCGNDAAQAMERRAFALSVVAANDAAHDLPPTHMGASGGWAWELAGELELGAGVVTLRVRDADVGFESADAVLFTRDFELDAERLEARFPTPEDPRAALREAWGTAGLRGDPGALPSGEWAGAAHLARLALQTPTRAAFEARAAIVRGEVARALDLDLAAPRPPIAAQVTQRRELDGYSVEDVAFEAAPGQFVTGNLYRPLGKAGPFAGVLSAHGHLSWGYSGGYGRFAPESQQRAATLARMGAVVFAYDMVGFGDSAEAGWTHEDWHRGVEAFHVGEERPESPDAPDTLRRQTLNSVRALDFLLAQDGVDPERIGMTGSSGGGTQTFVLAALDPRVKVSAPVVMVSATFQGGCVCETGIPIRRGPRHETSSADLAALAAPRPQLVVSCGGDWTKHTPDLELPYLEHVYGLYGAHAALESAHFADEGHDFGPSKRRAVYAFFAQHLALERAAALDADGALCEAAVTLLDRRDLSVFDAAHPFPAAMRRPSIEPPPAIVLIVVDDLGWADLGVDIPGMPGVAQHRTPNIAAFARESLVLTNGYAAAPNCAPSRACLQTGRYTPRHGVYTVGSSARGKARDRALVPIENTTTLADDELTLAEVLGGGRYTTIHVGKWHLGADPRTQGYDLNYGGDESGHPKSYFGPFEQPGLAGGPQGEYLPTRLTSEAIARVGVEERPFLHLAYYTVHTPLQAQKERVAERRAAGAPHATYAAMVEALDAELGRLFAALDEQRVEDGDLHSLSDALVILTSDNGGLGSVTNRAALRGCKGTLDEGGIRVPWIVRWRGHITPGVNATPVHHVDLLPTLAALTSTPVPERIALDGVDLTQLWLKGTPPKREALYWHFPAYLEGESDRFAAFRTTPGGAVRMGDWKLIEYFEPTASGAPRVELYDLAHDVREARDLAEAEPERRDALLAALRAWRAAVQAPVPTRPEPAYSERARGD
ncbi:MAG: sulfatase-like hydrolase/transferase [Planctomycetota bacterium]